MPKTPDDAPISAFDASRRLNRPLSETAARTIAEHLAPLPEGARVPSERDLSAQLGISRTAIREALVVLEMAGEIYTVPGKGRFTTGSRERAFGGQGDWLSREAGQLKDLDEIRELLESRAVQRMSPSQARQAAIELQSILDQMQAVVDKGNYDKAAALDGSFHRVLVSFCSNRTLRDLALHFIEVTDEAVHDVYEAPGSAEHSLAQHRDIQGALAEGDVRVASLLVAAHQSSASRYAIRTADKERKPQTRKN